MESNNWQQGQPGGLVNRQVITHNYCMQGLFARVGSGDPLRVFHLLHNNTLDTVESFIVNGYVQLVTTKATC